MTSGLAALEARLADDLEFLQLPAPRWTPPLQHDGEPVADVAIVGAGMTGLALAFQRRRPARRRQLQELELVDEPCLERREAARHARPGGAVVIAR